MPSAAVPSTAVWYSTHYSLSGADYGTTVLYSLLATCYLHYSHAQPRLNRLTSPRTSRAFSTAFRPLHRPFAESREQTEFRRVFPGPVRNALPDRPSPSPSQRSLTFSCLSLLSPPGFETRADELLATLLHLCNTKHTRHHHLAVLRLLLTKGRLINRTAGTVGLPSPSR